MNKKNWYLLFLPILLLTAFSSLFSLLTSDFYIRDSVILGAKSHYLDLINIGIIVPLGIVMFILAVKKVYWAKLFIIGIMVDVAYMFGLNALSLVVNELFLIYIALFGLSIFGIIFGYGDVKQSGNYLENPIKMRLSGIFLMLFSIIPFVVWLIEIVSSIVNRDVPESIVGMNIPVNVIHVFDLAFVLPVIIICAIQLLKGKLWGLIMSSILMAYVFLTCISMLGMELGLKYNNLHFDEGQLYSMYLLTPLGIFPLIFLFMAINRRFSHINN